MKARNPSSLQYIWIFVFALILIGTVLLGALQVTWITQAAQTEKFRYIGDIISGTSRGIYSSLEDIRTIAPVVQQQVSAKQGRLDADNMREILELWNNRAHYPDLLTRMFLCSADGVISVSRRDGSVTQADARTASKLSGLLIESPNGPSLYAAMDELLTQGYVCILPDDYQRPNWYRSMNLSAAAPLRQFAVLKIDIAYYLGTLLPSVFSGTIADTEYHISPEVLPDGKDEKDDNVSIRFHIPAPSLEVAGLSESFLTSRIVSVPIPMAGGDDGSPDVSAHVSSEKRNSRSVRSYPAVGHVSFLFEGGSVDAKFNRWVVSNAGVSIGLLLILATSFSVMFVLYNRSGRLRRMEQEFVASMSHELRLPVTVIKAVSDNLSSGIVTKIDRAREYGREIHNEALRLEHMVESILMYSGLQSGQGVRSRGQQGQPVALKDLCESAIREIKALSNADDLEIRAEYNGDTEAVHADGEGLKTVVQNLLLNAVTHGLPSEPGKQPNIRLLVNTDDPAALRICVEDNGRGIRKPDQQYIWDPFYRTETSYRNQEPGSGLGLHLIRQIVKLNGGTVGVESPYKTASATSVQGCRFTVTLPRNGAQR